MRKRLVWIIALFTITLSGVYISSPLIAAHKLREAVRSSDTQSLTQMVEWGALRSSIRTTVTKNAKLLPVANKIASNVRPTMWQRIRSVFGHSMLDRFIETYITPEGLPKLYRAKNKWHDRIKAKQEPMVVQATLVPQQLANAWPRIKRAEFKSPFRFVLEIQDRHVASRLISSTFQLSSISLSGFDWKLVGISIRNLDAAKHHLSKLNGF